MSGGLIEILVLLGFVLPICWWQLHDLKKAKQETARKRAAQAQQKREQEAAAVHDAPAPADAPATDTTRQ